MGPVWLYPIIYPNFAEQDRRRQKKNAENAAQNPHNTCITEQDKSRRKWRDINVSLMMQIYAILYGLFYHKNELDLSFTVFIKVDNWFNSD